MVEGEEEEEEKDEAEDGGFCSAHVSLGECPHGVWFAAQSWK